MESNNRRLPALIQAAIDHGSSTREIAHAAQRFGHKISHTYVHALWRENVAKAPDREMIQALAAGLGVSPAEVQQAVFLDYYGWDPAEGLGEFAFLMSLPDEVQRFVRIASLGLSNIPEAMRTSVIDECTNHIITAATS